jgi:ABC-type Fe3+-hydroxamate transport system substrate-binding protein
MPAIEYLDDIEGFIAEVLDIDNRPDVRVQGRGTQVPNSAPPKIQAQIVLTHFERGTDIIREAVVIVGLAEQDAAEELRATLNERIDEMKMTLNNRGCLVAVGRWTR